MVQKVIILLLGGGYGTRLFGDYNKATYSPKGLIEVGSKPCIEYSLDAFHPDLIEKVVLETNKEGREHYHKWINSAEYPFKIELLIDPVSSPENNLGVLETIYNTWRELNTDLPILIISPDNLVFQNQNHLITSFSEGAQMLYYELQTKLEARKYGNLNLGFNNSVIECVEKPKKPLSPLIRTSIEIWDNEVLEKLGKWIIESNEKDKVGSFINHLIECQKPVRAISLSGAWFDIGNQSDLDRAREYAS